MSCCGIGTVQQTELSNQTTARREFKGPSPGGYLDHLAVGPSQVRREESATALTGLRAHGNHPTSSISSV